MITSCSNPNNSSNPTNNNAGNGNGISGQGTLTLQIPDLDSSDVTLNLYGEMAYKSNITKYQITGNVIQLCEGRWEIPLLLNYSCGNESFQITNIVNRPENDDVIINLNGEEYICHTINTYSGGIETEDNIYIPWYTNTVLIGNFLNSSMATIKFKYRGVESNELVFLFNQDLGNSAPAGENPGGNPGALPDITGTWLADRPGLTGRFIFSSNGTGTVYSGNDAQQTSFNWRTYKDGTNNMLEITNCSWFSGLGVITFSIAGNTLTTEKKLGTQGYTFTKQ